MYSGDNKKAKESQKAFAEALVRLLQDHEYADISVSSLCRESGISRQTFYTLFQCKDNVLRYAILHNYSYPSDEGIPTTGTLAAHLGHIFSIYLDANYDFLRLIVERKLISQFYECFLKWMEDGNGYFLRVEETNLRTYLSISVAGTLTGIIDAYMQENVRRDPAALERMVTRLFSGEYFRQEISEVLR